MHEAAEIKAMASELRRRWEDLLQLEGISPEVEYRIRRLADRLMPVLHKTYIKTGLGRSAILQCMAKTDIVKERIHSTNEGLFHALTDLEKFYEDFLRTAYLYSVNAVSFVAKLKSQPYGASLILGENNFI
jgi:hypothetical protein